MVKQKWIWKGKLICSLPILHNYAHSDAYYCPLANFYYDNCPYKHVSCIECPEAEFFLEVNGELIPVNKLPLYGKI